MHKSKLIETLKCLTTQELRLFRQFLQAAYCHETPIESGVWDLAEHLLQYENQWEHPNLDREIVFAQVFKGKLVAKNRLEKNMTFLLRELRRFIVLEMQRHQTDEHEELLQLACFFEQRQNFDEFERYLTATRVSLEEVSSKNTSHWLRVYSLESSITHHLSLFNDRKTDFNLQQSLSALNAHYLASQLDYWVLYLAQARSVPLPQPPQLAPISIIEWLVAQMPMEQMPMIEAGYQAFLLLAKPIAEREAFMLFLGRVNALSESLPPEKYKNYLTIARSYCIQEFNKGNEAFFSITFDMYREHLEKGYLYRNGTIHAAILKNLVSMGLRMGQYPWTVELLERHRQCIAGVATPEDAYKFNLAVCHFHQAEYAAVLDLLSFNYEELFYKIAAKRLEIKTLYEIHSPIFDARLDAFNILIFRIGGKQLADTYATSNKNFGAFLKRILNPSTLHNPKRRQKLKTEIAQTATIVEKVWLLEILER